MGDADTETGAKSPITATKINTNVDPAPSAAARNRFPQRQTSSQEQSPARPPLRSRRRSSLLSFSSLEDIRQAFNEDIISPKTTNQRKVQEDEEVTHWHSTPLAFAILPALGGLIFKDGSAFITDMLLLGLAAIFMNWSIRLPWDWYYSAQALRRDVNPQLDLLSEDSEDYTAMDTVSPTGTSPVASPDTLQDENDTSLPLRARQQEAVAELRRQELMALVATFVFPVLAAYLLHVIRAQLSRPSTSLVSDYNLSIFLLAAEIKPCRQVVRLVSHRTLYLQRTVAGTEDRLASPITEKDTSSALASRIADLEDKLAQNTIIPANLTMAQKADISELSAEMKKRYEPRLDGLERAVRRYEKRFSTLAMVMEQRLASLETRLQEALSLAAVAAQHSGDRGAVWKFTDAVTGAFAWPVKTMWNVLSSPLALLDDLYALLKKLLLGPGPPLASRRKTPKYDGGARDERPRDKPLVRKMVR